MALQIIIHTSDNKISDDELLYLRNLSMSDIIRPSVVISKSVRVINFPKMSMMNKFLPQEIINKDIKSLEIYYFGEKISLNTFILTLNKNFGIVESIDIFNAMANLIEALKDYDEMIHWFVPKVHIRNGKKYFSNHKICIDNEGYVTPFYIYREFDLGNHPTYVPNDFKSEGFKDLHDMIFNADRWYKNACNFLKGFQDSADNFTGQYYDDYITYLERKTK